MKIGCALPFGLFSGKESPLSRAFGGAEGVLDFCAQTFDTVELRTVSATADPQAVLAAAKKCLSLGLGVTIHGQLTETAETFFAPYLALFDAHLQAAYSITVHPRADLALTECLLAEICRIAEKEQYPVTVMLENQRVKNGVGTGVCADVAAIVRRIASPYLKVCFDFGHSLSNERNFALDTPTVDFYALVRHTHIHSLDHGRTHFPITHGETLLDRNLDALVACGYDGVLSLELSAERFEEYYDVRASFARSAALLRQTAAAAVRHARLLAQYEQQYIDAVREARARLEQYPAAVALVGPAAYLLKLGATRIAVDVSLVGLPTPPSARQELAALLADFDAAIVTHAHRDHYDAALLRALPPSVCRLVPDFMADGAGDCTAVTAEGKYLVGETEISFFASEHRSVPQYGFAIRYGGRHLVFSGDVRDYTAAHPVFPDTALLVAHLWLGRAAALAPKEELCADLVRFIDSHRAERVLLGHLYDTRRPLADRWTDHHVRLVQESLPHLRAAHPFEVISLGKSLL